MRTCARVLTAVVAGVFFVFAPTAAAFATLPVEGRSPLLALAEDPVLDVRIDAGRLLADVPDQALAPEAVVPREQLIAAYRAAQASNPDRPESHHNLGLLEIALGRPGAAERAFADALAVDTLFVPAAVNLADLFQGSGRDAEGEPILRDLVARLPDEPNARLALGFWLVRNGEPEAAREELRRAAEEGASLSPRFAYVYAVSLADSGDRAGAIRVLSRNLDDFPYDRDTLIALAVYESQAGNMAAATAHAELLAALEPEDASIRDFLNQLRR